MLKEISNLLQLSFQEHFFVKVLLICEKVCKGSLFLINFSVERIVLHITILSKIVSFSEMSYPNLGY